MGNLTALSQSLHTRLIIQFELLLSQSTIDYERVMMQLPFQRFQKVQPSMMACLVEGAGMVLDIISYVRVQQHKPKPVVIQLVLLRALW